jgi:hypothetical protein
MEKLLWRALVKINLYQSATICNFFFKDLLLHEMGASLIKKLTTRILLLQKLLFAFVRELETADSDNVENGQSWGGRIDNSTRQGANSEIGLNDF